MGGLAACTCATPIVVTEIQKSDKKLTCKDIILEINEAEHFKELARQEKGIGFGNMFMPFCWVSSYVDAGKAVDAANARISYLGHIYDVLDCGGKSDRQIMEAPATIMPNNIRQPRQQFPSGGKQYPSLQQMQQQQQPMGMMAAPMETNMAAAAQAEEDEPMVKGEVPDAEVRKNMHQHIDKYGKVYTHSHYYAGPHKHGDDQ